MVYRALELFKEKKYKSCLTILKKAYFKNPLRAEIYLLFFFCHLKSGKKPLAMKWIREAFHQFPDHVKIAEAYAYFCAVFKKDPEEALIPLARLTRKKSASPFTDLILSRYHQRKGDLERSCLFARSAYEKNPKHPVFKNRLILLLHRLKSAEELKEFSSDGLTRKLSASLNAKELKNNARPLEKIEILRKKAILLLNQKVLRSPLFQYWFYRKYGGFLPSTRPEVKLQIFMEQGRDFFKEQDLKKQNNHRLFDENSIRMLVWILLAALIFYLLKEVL